MREAGLALLPFAEGIPTSASHFIRVADELRVADDKRLIAELREWAGANTKLDDAFTIRKEMPFVRECHGNLHSGNIMIMDGQVEVSDRATAAPDSRLYDVATRPNYKRLRERAKEVLAARNSGGCAP